MAPAPQHVEFCQDAAWSPDGKWLAFSENIDGKYDVYVMKANGSQAQKLVADDADNLYPTWSRDGKWILYTFRSGATGGLRVADIKRAKPSTLCDDSTHASFASWSPDGSRIVFMARQDGKTQIEVMHADGTARTVLTHGTGNNMNPTWSPDGAKIVFESDREGPGGDHLYVMNADGSGEVRITSTPGWVFPAWSPDGKRILCGHAVDPRGLHAMASDGTGEARIGELRAFFGRFSPSGASIACVVGGYPRSSIYVTKADGSQAVPLTPVTPTR